jgi:hypothetical protein
MLMRAVLGLDRLYFVESSKQSVVAGELNAVAMESTKTAMTKDWTATMTDVDVH